MDVISFLDSHELSRFFPILSCLHEVHERIPHNDVHNSYEHVTFVFDVHAFSIKIFFKVKHTGGGTL